MESGEQDEHSVPFLFVGGDTLGLRVIPLTSEMQLWFLASPSADVTNDFPFTLLPLLYTYDG